MWKEELPTVAGVALVVIAITAVVARWEVSAAAAVLAMFGAALVAAPVIAKIKIGSGGINGSLDELHSSQKTLAAEVAKTPASGAIANHLAIIAAAVPKTDEISRALAANDAVLAAAAEIRGKLKQSLAEMP